MSSHSFAISLIRSRALVTVVGVLGLALPTLAQNAGEVVKVVKIPTPAPGNPVLLEGDGFGRQVVNLGDFDGDGTVDLLVGATNNNDGLTPDAPVSNAGSVWLIQLRPNGTAKQSRKYSLATGLPFLLEEDDYFGKGVSKIGDLDGDGVIDIAIGAPGDDDGLVDQGAVYILFLNADGSIKSHQKISALEGDFITLTARSEFGRGIAPMGDLDGDGILDLAVSRMPRGSTNPATGTVFILYLRADGTVRHFMDFTLEDLGLYYPRNQFGFVLSSNDLDGDGVMDLVCGDIAYDGKSDNGALNPHDGAVYFVTMNPDGTPKDWSVITQGIGGFNVNLVSGDHWGSGISAVDADVDGDGVNDLVVGQKRADDSDPVDCTPTSHCSDDWVCCSENGAAWVLFLNPDRTVKGYQRISNLYGNFPWYLNKEDRFGQSVAGLGDLDGDGLQEFAISARFEDEAAPNAGMVYILTLATGNVVQTAAWFEPDVTYGGVPLTVNFQDLSQGVNLDSWSWQFGDGGTSTAQHPTHAYTAPGTYSVTLTVEADSGPDTVTRDDLIVVDLAPFIVDFDAAPLSGFAPLEVVFTDATVGSPLSWSWSFGDGGTSTAQHPTHTYIDDGTYSVSLTVVDAVQGEGTLARNGLIEVSSDFTRIGCDPNATGTLSVQSGAPQIGTVIVFGIDNPYGTQAAGSTTWLRAAFAPAAAYPCGFSKPGYGMAFAGAPGEILLSLNPTPFSFNGTAFGGAGTPGLVTIPVPNNLGLVGTTVFSQGVIFDSVGASGVRYAVTDGLEFTLR